MGENIIDESLNVLQIESTKGAAHSFLYGITSTATVLPLKVTDDGSGLGKLVIAFD